MRASQTRILDSEMGPAVMPSGGEEVRSLYSWKRRFVARVDVIFEAGGNERRGRGRGSGRGRGRGGKVRREEGY